MFFLNAISPPPSQLYKPRPRPSRGPVVSPTRPCCPPSCSRRGVPLCSRLAILPAAAARRRVAISFLIRTDVTHRSSCPVPCVKYSAAVARHPQFFAGRLATGVPCLHRRHTTIQTPMSSTSLRRNSTPTPLPRSPLRSTLCRSRRQR